MKMNNLKKGIIICVVFELVAFWALTATGWLPYEAVMDTVIVLVIATPLFLMFVLEPIADYISEYIVYGSKKKKRKCEEGC